MGSTEEGTYISPAKNVIVLFAPTSLADAAARFRSLACTSKENDIMYRRQLFNRVNYFTDNNDGSTSQEM